MEIQQALINRRTIHKFNSRKVPEEYVERAICAANQAPCHRHTFPWRFTRVNKEKRRLIEQLYLKDKYDIDKINKSTDYKLIAKFVNPSHLIVASQISVNDQSLELENYAACACAIQNLLLSLAVDGVGSKWSTVPIIKNEGTYKIVEISPDKEKIIGFLWIGYGEIPARIDRPSISSVYRKL